MIKNYAPCAPVAFLYTSTIGKEGGKKVTTGERKLVGTVVNYLSRLGVAIVDLNDSLAVGDRISIEGNSTNIQQIVDSMQIEHQSIAQANKGESIGLKLADHCRKGDCIYRL